MLSDRLSRAPGLAAKRGPPTPWSDLSPEFEGISTINATDQLKHVIERARVEIPGHLEPEALKLSGRTRKSQRT